MATSQGDLDHLMNVWAARNIRKYQEPDAPFTDTEHMHAVIDEVPFGAENWTTVTVQYSGELDDASPAYLRESYTFYMRDVLRSVEVMAESSDFDGKFDYVPYKEFGPDGRRRWSNLMSGQWAWRQAVR